MKGRAVAALTLAAVLLTACGGQETAKGLKTFTEPGTLNGEVVSTKKGGERGSREGRRRGVCEQRGDFAALFR